MSKQRVLWMKSLGTAADPLEDAWWERSNGVLVNHATCKENWTAKPGDAVVYYASGRRRVFAVGLVTSTVYNNPTNAEGWDNRVDVTLDHACPVNEGLWLESLNATDRDLLISIRRRSALKLRPAEYERALKGLEHFGPPPPVASRRRG